MHRRELSLHPRCIWVIQSAWSDRESGSNHEQEASKHDQGKTELSVHDMVQYFYGHGQTRHNYGVQHIPFVRLYRRLASTEMLPIAEGETKPYDAGEGKRVPEEMANPECSMPCVAQGPLEKLYMLNDPAFLVGE